MMRLVTWIAGWTLLVVGGVCLILPGPGVLAVSAGLALLSRHHRWAERVLGPVRAAAEKAAAAGSRTWLRVTVSAAGALTVIGAGILWMLSPSVPTWWPLHENWWLPGGWATGSGLVLSGLVAAGALARSVYMRRGRSSKPAPVVESEPALAGV